MEKAGADALELNVYQLITDVTRSAESVESEMVSMVADLAGRLKIPVAVKLSPYFTCVGHLARRLVDAGARGLILFNRFFQPDVDVEALETKRTLTLSDSSEVLLRLRWLAILSAQIDTSYAVTGGVHKPVDALKAILCGADAVQVVSLLLRHGPESLKELCRGVARWSEEHEYESLEQARGSLDLHRTPDPAAYSRGNYVHILQSWRGYLPPRS